MCSHNYPQHLCISDTNCFCHTKCVQSSPTCVTSVSHDQIFMSPDHPTMCKRQFCNMKKKFSKENVVQHLKLRWFPPNDLKPVPNPNEGEADEALPPNGRLPSPLSLVMILASIPLGLEVTDFSYLLCSPVRGWWVHAHNYAAILCKKERFLSGIARITSPLSHRSCPSARNTALGNSVQNSIRPKGG